MEQAYEHRRRGGWKGMAGSLWDVRWLTTRRHRQWQPHAPSGCSYRPWNTSAT